MLAIAGLFGWWLQNAIAGAFMFALLLFIEKLVRVLIAVISQSTTEVVNAVEGSVSLSKVTRHHRLKRLKSLLAHSKFPFTRFSTKAKCHRRSLKVRMVRCDPQPRAS
jgi:hypothetical protein